MSERAMETTEQPHFEENAQADPRPAVYLLRGFVEGESDAACLPQQRTAEVQSLFSRFEASPEFEYPSPRALLSDTSDAPLAPDPAFPDAGFTESSTPPDSRTSGRHGNSGADAPDAGSRTTAGTMAGIACGTLAVGVLVAGAAISSQSAGLLLAATLMLVGGGAVLALVLRAAPSPSRPDLDQKPGSSPIWGLPPGAGVRDAVKIGFRTGGLGLLVRPTENLEEPHAGNSGVPNEDD